MKVTAYEALHDEDLPRLRPDECDVMFFPDGVPCQSCFALL